MRAPTAFVVALGGGAIAAALLAFGRADARRHVWLDRESTFAAFVTHASHVVAIAVAAGLVLGVLRLRRDGEPIGLLLLGAVTLLVGALAHPIYEYHFVDRAPDYLAILSARRWLGRIDATGAVAFAAGVVFLGEHTDRARGLAVPVLALAVLAHPPLAIADQLARACSDVPGTAGVWKAAVILAAIQLAFAAATLAILDAAARTPRPSTD